MEKGKLFYIIFNEDEKSFYDDEKYSGCLTKDPLEATRYSSADEANEEVKYFYTPEKWKIKKVSITIDDV